MPTALAFDGFDRSAMAKAESSIDDMETMEAKPAQKTSEVFLHLTIATERLLALTAYTRGKGFSAAYRMSESGYFRLFIALSHNVRYASKS